MWDCANIDKNGIFKAGHSHQTHFIVLFLKFKHDQIEKFLISIFISSICYWRGLTNVQNVHATFFHLLLPFQNANQRVPMQIFQQKNAVGEIFPWMSHIMTFETRKAREEDCFAKHTKITGHPMSAR